MTLERWEQIEGIYHAALPRDAGQRAAFLDNACRGDGSLRAEVESLLAQAERGKRFIESPALEVAAKALATAESHSLVGKRLGVYEILAPLGSGGMGVVYQGRDSRLGRLAAIKVLPLGVEPDQRRMRRFLLEAKAASALNHPNVATIYEIGESDSGSFIAMEYVEGETLAARVNGRPLAVGQILEIGIQIADALDEAHSKGIIHRDVKPTNIMLTARGQVKVLDFGLAKIAACEGRTFLGGSGAETATVPGLVLGTVQYMSPEQVLGRDVDQRTDLFSLGVVLYEMATGRPPFAGATATETMDQVLHQQPEAITRLNPGISLELEHIINKALDKEREARYPSAHDLLADLRNLRQDRERSLVDAPPQVARVTAGEKRPERLAGWWRYAQSHRWAIALSVLILVGIALFMMRSIVARPTLSFSPRDWILIADVDNQTKDPLFDRSLFTALSVSLAQSTHANVFPRSRLGEVLKRMGKTEGQRVDETLGREVCQRENIRGLVALSISQFGRSYVLSYRLIDPHTGEVVRSQMEPARNQEQILGALDKIATRVRRDLGESIASIQKASRPLPKVTTPSLQGLKLFADEQAAWRQRKWREAVQLCQSALQQDPDFAMVHAALGAHYFTQYFNDRAKGKEHLEKALQLSARTTAREQLYIQASYHNNLRHFDEAAKFYNLYLNAYPDDFDVRYNLGNFLRLNARYEEAATQYQEVIRTKPSDMWALNNLALSYSGLGRLDEALRYFDKAIVIEPAAYETGNLNHEYGFTLVNAGQEAKARQVFTNALSKPENKGLALRSLALLDLYQGKYRDAQARLRESALIAEANKTPHTRGRNLIYLSYILGAEGDLRGCLRELDEAAMAYAGLSPEVGPRASSFVVLGTYYARHGEVQKAARTLKLAEQNVVSGDHPVDRAYLHNLEGEVELARHNPARALALLHLADKETTSRAAPEQRHPRIVESLAHAYRTSGNLDQAIVWYEKLLGMPQKPLGYEAQPFWQEAHYHLASAYASRGQKDKARKPLEALLSLWKDADPDLPLLKKARQLRTNLEK